MVIKTHAQAFKKAKECGKLKIRAKDSISEDKKSEKFRNPRKDSATDSTRCCANERESEPHLKRTYYQ